MYVLRKIFQGCLPEIAMATFQLTTAIKKGATLRGMVRGVWEPWGEPSLSSQKTLQIWMCHVHVYINM